MFDWLKRKVEFVAIKSATEDIERQLNMLQGSDDSSVGLVLASATFWRLFWTNCGMVPSGAFSLEEPRDEAACSKFQWEVNRLIKDSQKEGNYASAAGLMIQLHTLRAISMPELRIWGRQMWKELSRGMPYVPEYLPKFFDAAGVPMPVGASEEIYFIPPGLEF